MTITSSTGFDQSDTRIEVSVALCPQATVSADTDTPRGGSATITFTQSVTMSQSYARSDDLDWKVTVLVPHAIGTAAKDVADGILFNHDGCDVQISLPASSEVRQLGDLPQPAACVRRDGGGWSVARRAPH